MPRALDIAIAILALLILSPVLLRRRDRDQARQPRAGGLPAAPGRPRRRRVRAAQAAHDGARLRPGRDRRRRHPRRPPGHGGRPGAAPHLARRDPQPAQRPARGDGDRRPTADDPRPGRRLHPPPAPPPRGPAGDHRLGAGPGPGGNPLGGADRARHRVRRTPRRRPRPAHPAEDRLAAGHRARPRARSIWRLFRA